MPPKMEPWRTERSDLRLGSVAESEAVEVRSTETFLPLTGTESEADRWCRSRLESWSLEPISTFQAVAVMGELLSNAFRHGKGSVQVDLRLRSGRIWIGVRDHGPGPMRTEGAFPPRSAEHGLGRVAQASHVWGVNRHFGEGTTVWSELEITRRPARRLASSIGESLARDDQKLSR